MNQAGRSDDIRDITEPGWREREAERHERLKNAIPEVSAGAPGKLGDGDRGTYHTTKEELPPIPIPLLWMIDGIDRKEATKMIHDYAKTAIENEYDRGFTDAIKAAIAVCKNEEKQLLWREGQTLPRGEPGLLQMASVANCCAAYIDRIVVPNKEVRGGPSGPSQRNEVERS